MAFSSSLSVSHLSISSLIVSSLSISSLSVSSFLHIHFPSLSQKCLHGEVPRGGEVLGIFLRKAA